MKPADPLGGLLPPAPPGRDLPHHDRRRRELLALVHSEHPAERRWPGRAWLAPLGAALAVLVIVAGVFLLPRVFGGTRHGGGTTPAASGLPAGTGWSYPRRAVTCQRSIVNGLQRPRPTRGASADGSRAR